VGLSPTGKAPPYHGARQYETYTDFQRMAGQSLKAVIQRPPVIGNHEPIADIEKSIIFYVFNMLKNVNML
jgi:hypothetical protein